MSSSPVHSPCVGRCDPGAPPRGERSATALEISAAPRAVRGAGPGVAAERGREGSAAEPPVGGLKRSGAALVPAGASPAREGPGRELLHPRQRRCSISFLCGSV